MSIGLGEILVILIVGFVFVGPEDLPKVARTIARGVKKMRMLMHDMNKSFEQELELEKVQENLTEVKKESMDFQKVQQDTINHALEK